MTVRFHNSGTRSALLKMLVGLLGQEAAYWKDLLSVRASSTDHRLSASLGATIGADEKPGFSP
jgi:hypothetical protein